MWARCWNQWNHGQDALWKHRNIFVFWMDREQKRHKHNLTFFSNLCFPFKSPIVFMVPVKCKTSWNKLCVFGATDVVLEKCLLLLMWEGTDSIGFHALMKDEPFIFSHLFHYLFVGDDLTNTSIAGWKGYNTTTSFWTTYFSQIYCHITKYSWG